MKFLSPLSSDIIPASTSLYSLGNSTNYFSGIYSQAGNFQQVGIRDFATGLPILNSFVTSFLTSTNGAFISGPSQNFAGGTYDAFGFRGRNRANGNSENIIMGTGDASAGNSGGFLFQTGTASGTRGKIQFRDGTEGLNKVWTSDANGNGSWNGDLIVAGIFAEYSNSGNFTFTASPAVSPTVFDTVSNDASLIYNTANGQITIPSNYVGTARLNIKAMLTINGAASVTPWVAWRIKKNGSFLKYGEQIKVNNPIGINTTIKCDFEVRGIANDYFEIELFHDADFVCSGTLSFLNVHIYAK